MLRRLILLVSVLSLGACAGQVPWTNPNLPRKVAEKDYTSCRHYAESQTGSGAGGSYFDDDRASAPMSGADRAVTRDEMAGIIDYCMRAKGYFPMK